MSLRMRNPWVLFGVVLLSGCVRSCGCGGSGQSAAGSAEEEGEQTGPASPSSTGSAGSAAASPSGTGRMLNAQQFTPAPDTKLTRQLIAARTEIEKGQVYAKLDAPVRLAAVLGVKLGEFHGVGNASSTERAGSGTSIAIAARNYVAGKRNARVKIIDTAQSPEARRAVSEHIAELGNTAAGNQHGSFVRGYPAVVAGFEADHASRATALIANRYLVQALVHDPSNPDQALQLIEALDWGKLAPKQGKMPAAK
jgi:hypothetical protein